MPRKHSTPSRNPALGFLERVRKSKPKSWVGRISRFQDLESFAFSFGLGIDCLLRDRPCLPSVFGIFADLFDSIRDVSDVLGYIETCSNIRTILLQDGRWNVAPLRALRSRWVRRIITAIEAVYEPSQIVHPSPVFDAVVTFLGWLKRLPVFVRDSDDAVLAYHEEDQRLSSVDFGDNVYVPQLREIWREWLGSFKLTPPFLPRHGSGSTADSGKVRASKWRNLCWDRTARVCLHYADLQKVGEYNLNPAATRQAKVVFVPKQAGKDRAICMEPAWLQYFQQGVAGQIVEFIHRRGHPLAGYIDLYSQERNRGLCARAITDRLTTIDLSDASDCVSWRLIKQLAQGMPLLGYLHATRSTSTLLSGSVRSFDKYAPMGSALCFPIECILFASVVELAYRIRNDQASKGHLSGCSVYGDDIICPTEIYYLVRDILTTLGFKVNAQKTHSGGRYFESCGVEYLDGALVNATRHPRNHVAPRDVMSPEQVSLVSDLANTLGDAGYRLARRHLLQSYEGVKVTLDSKLHSFMDFVLFDARHCAPVGEPYNRWVWNRKVQALGVWKKSVWLSQRQSDQDYEDHSSSLRPETRRDRILRKRRIPVRVNPDPKWSTKAVIFLARHGFRDMLEEGDIRVIGACRTGRTHCSYRRVFVARDYAV